MEGDEVEVVADSADSEEPAQEDPGLEASADGGDAGKDDLGAPVGPPDRASRGPQQPRKGSRVRARFPEDDEVGLIPDLQEPARQPPRSPAPKFAAAPVTVDQNGEEPRPLADRPPPERRARRLRREPRRGPVDDR